jgi:antitoxin (DNA-binding transcriptional repressor) of toxin-antitoxin stability system
MRAAPKRKLTHSNGTLHARPAKRRAATAAYQSADVVSVEDFRKDPEAVADRAAKTGDRMLVRRRGKALAAVVPVEDLAALEALEDHWDRVMAREAMLDTSRPVPWEKVKQRLGL